MIILDYLTAICAISDDESQIYWIDLQVLTSNYPVIHLYKKLNSQEQGIVTNTFRIDSILMTLNVIFNNN